MFKINSNLKEYIQLGGFVGLAQINPIAGKLEYNSNKIISYIKQAESIGLDIVAFPKYALLGSDLKNFRTRYPFIITESKKWLEKISRREHLRHRFLPLWSVSATWKTLIF